MARSPLMGWRLVMMESIVAYGVQKSGSDWRTWNVLEIATGKVLEDKIGMGQV